MNNYYPEYELYEVNKNCKCVKCGHKGAIQYYGTWHPCGIGDRANDFKIISMEKYRNNPYMSRACGFGGTIPWECTNCGNIGLIDYGGLEGYEMAFESIKE